MWSWIFTAGDRDFHATDVLTVESLEFLAGGFLFLKMLWVEFDP